MVLDPSASIANGRCIFYLVRPPGACRHLTGWRYPSMNEAIGHRRAGLRYDSASTVCKPKTHRLITMATTSFKALSDGSKEDWQVLTREHQSVVADLPERILEHMRLLDDNCGALAVNRLQHSLQTAELAAAASEDDEYVVCTLLHDIGDTLAAEQRIAGTSLYRRRSPKNPVFDCLRGAQAERERRADSGFNGHAARPERVTCAEQSRPSVPCEI